MTNLATNLVSTAERHPDGVAIKLDAAELTWRQLHQLAAKAAGALREAGLKPGDRVSLILPNVPAYPILFYGTLLAGGIVVPMNPLLKAGEIEYFYSDSGATFSFVWPDFMEEAVKGGANPGTQVIQSGPMGPSDDDLAARRRRDDAGGARRRRHGRDPLHLGHDRKAQGRRADPRQPQPQRPAVRHRHHADGHRRTSSWAACRCSTSSG